MRGHPVTGPRPTVFAESRRRDPTQTLALRRRFSAEMYNRFRDLKGAIREAVVDNDVLGLSAGLETQQQRPSPPRRQAFAFERDSDKVQDFLDWLEEAEQAGILETKRIPELGGGTERAWSDIYIQQAYQQGVQTGRAALIAAGYAVPAAETVGGIASIMAAPFHADRVGLLYTRTFNELKGITDDMAQRISRELAQGMAEGIRPRDMATRLNRQVDIGLRRARTLARTEVIRAHHAATMQEYKNWEAQGVRVIAEWQTAGDSRVCPACEALEGREFELEDIEPMIPLHPNCRCIALPVDVTDESSANRNG